MDAERERFREWQAKPKGERGTFSAQLVTDKCPHCPSGYSGLVARQDTEQEVTCTTCDRSFTIPGLTEAEATARMASQ